MRQRRTVVLLGCWLTVLLAAGGGSAGASPPLLATTASPDDAASCPVTQPNGRRPPDPERVFGGTGPGGHGTDALWTNLEMWGEAGTVEVPASHRLPDGALGPMKWSWYQYDPGLLLIEGRRLDVTAPPLRTTAPGGYGGQGFHPTGLIFPTGGCWEITGRVGEERLIFVTRVVAPDPLAAPVPPPPAPGAAGCRVTQPDGGWPSPTGIVPDPSGRGGGGYGNDALWTNLWMWDEASRVPVPTSHVLPDGALGEMKWAWYRYVPGRLTIAGRRLDAPAPPLRASISDGYGDLGFQVSGLIFPTAGCWEVTGAVGDARLTFVTLVIAPVGHPR